MKDQTSKAYDLVDRYVAAVGRRLPAKTAPDITAELREAVLERLEAKQAELGRPAGPEDAAEIIKSFGSPMLAAARYTGAQSLLGPNTYPYFWPVQRLVVGIVATVAIVGFLVRGVLSDDPMRQALQGLGAAWNGALFAFAVVTIVFIAMDRAGAGLRIEETWRPEQLPRDSTIKPKSLFESLFSLAWDAIFIAWWVGWLHFPNTLLGAEGKAGLTLDFNDAAWSAIFGPVLVMAGLNAAIHAADVLHPTWSRVRSVAVAVVTILGLWTVWRLAQAQVTAGQLLVVHGPDEAVDRVASLNDAFATVSQVMLYGLAIGFSIGLAVEGWRLFRSLEGGAAASGFAKR